MLETVTVAVSMGFVQIAIHTNGKLYGYLYAGPMLPFAISAIAFARRYMKWKSNIRNRIAEL